MEAALPNRQSIRMKGWDYTSAGCYFVTMNTHKSRPLFGVIVNGRMVLNEAGRIAEECWQKIPEHFPTVAVDEFVVMPNHVHGVLHLRGKGFEIPNPSPQFGKPQAGALGTLVGAYKAAVSRILGRGGKFPARSGGHLSTRPAAGASAIWHRNYWDVIVRDKQTLGAIRNYIRFNPQNYAVVMNVGEPQCAGNRALLELPKTGFLASRGANAPHGRLPVKPGEAIISGFLSPMERAVFKAGLEHQRPLIWVKPWGLDEEGLARQARSALDEGRLLILSPFAESVEAPSIRRAAWCNQYVLAHCDRMVVGHLNPGGMLACILSESDPEMEILYL
jgi:REP element-mobilizing transposase RayT